MFRWEEENWCPVLLLAIACSAAGNLGKTSAVLAILMHGLCKVRVIISVQKSFLHRDYATKREAIETRTGGTGIDGDGLL